MKKGLWILSKAIPAPCAAKPEFRAIGLITVFAMGGHRHPTYRVLKNVVWQRSQAMYRLSILSISAKYSGRSLNFRTQSFEQK